MGHAWTYAEHRRALPQVHGAADGAEVTVEEHDTESTGDASYGGDGGRRTGYRRGRWSGRRRGRRVPGRRGDQTKTDGEQAAGELRLEARLGRGLSRDAIVIALVVRVVYFGSFREDAAVAREYRAMISRASPGATLRSRPGSAALPVVSRQPSVSFNAFLRLTIRRDRLVG